MALRCWIDYALLSVWCVVVLLLSVVKTVLEILRRWCEMRELRVDFLRDGEETSGRACGAGCNCERWRHQEELGRRQAGGGHISVGSKDEIVQGKSRATQRVYAVRIGRVSGLYDSWAECKSQVNGHKGAEFKSFVNREEAVRFMAQTISAYGQPVRQSG